MRHFTCKHVIEKQIDALGLPRTFLRAVLFMDNFNDPKVGRLLLPVLAGALKPGVKLHMVAVDDIGWFAAEAFDRPGEYLGACDARPTQQPLGRRDERGRAGRTHGISVQRRQCPGDSH